MITPDQLRDWAQDADDGEDVALDGDTLRELGEQSKALLVACDILGTTPEELKELYVER